MPGDEPNGCIMGYDEVPSFDGSGLVYQCARRPMCTCSCSSLILQTPYDTQVPHARMEGCSVLYGTQMHIHRNFFFDSTLDYQLLDGKITPSARH